MAKGKILKTIIDISGEISPTLGKSMQSVVDKLEGVNMKAVAAGAAVAAIGVGAAVGVGKATKYLAGLGNTYDKAANQMAASTGLVGDELANMEKQMQDVYGNNFGEDMQDVADSMTEVYRQTGLVGDALQNTTEDAFALRDTFGYDIPETARAAKAMMKNFGVSGEDAMGLIAAGAQNGLDYSGELIDSINEYSVQFAKLGFSADDMFKVFQAGADSGAWNLDKVGDAVKEFSIRSIDGSKGTVNAYKDLGLNADKMMATFAKGGPEAEKAFQQVTQKLIGVKDQVERDAIGVALFGTMWEDLGVDAVKALASTKSGAYDTGDALGKINEVKYNDLDSAMQGIKRQAEVALLPAAQEVSNAFVKLAPKIQEMVQKAGPVLEELAGYIGPIVEKAIELGEQGFGYLYEKVQELAPIISDFAQNGLAWVKDNMEWLIPVVGGLTAAFVAYKAISLGMAAWEAIKAAALATGTTVTGLATAATWALNTAVGFLTSPITLVVAAIALLVAGGIALYRNWDTVKIKCMELGAKLGEIWGNIKAFITNAITGISERFPIFGGYLQGWWKSIQDVIGSVKGIFKGLIDFVKNIFAGNWSGAWDSIVDTFGNIFGLIGNIAKAPINAVIGIVNGAIDGINDIGFTIPDWVPGLGGKAFSINIPKIPMLATGGFTDGPSIAGEAGTEAVISFDPAYRQQNLAYWAQAGRMLGADLSDYSLGEGVSGATYYEMENINFAPQIVVHGDADKRTIMEAIEEEFPEFIDMLESYLQEREAYVYG